MGTPDIINTYLLAAVLLFIALFCFWKENINKSGPQLFHFIFFVTVYYLFFYGIFPIWTVKYQQHPSFPTWIGATTGYFVACFLSMQILGYLLVTKFANLLNFNALENIQEGLKKSQEVKNNSPSGFILLALIAVISHFSFFIIPELQNLPSINQLQQPLWFFGFSILTWVSFSKRFSWRQLFLLIIVFIFYLIECSIQGLLSPIFVTVFIFISCSFYWRRYLYLIISVPILLMLFSSYGYVKHLSDDLLGNGETHIFEFQPELSRDALFASVNAATRRSSHSFMLEQVTDTTPSDIPFAEYSPFADAARNHIPRMVWPNKPEERKGNWFGIRYGFIDSGDKITSWNMPWISEFYIVYGYIKACFIAFFIGALLALITILLSSLPHKAVGFGLFSASMLPLFNQESNFSLMTGNFLTVTLFLGVGSYFFLYFYNRFFAR